jgi:hypothetical protein
MKRLLFLFIILPAYAHDAPKGWAYDKECCHDQDCHPMSVPPKVTWDGFQFPDGEFIPKFDKRILNSGDDQFHECRHITIVNGAKIIDAQRKCVYVPKGGV